MGYGWGGSSLGFIGPFLPIILIWTYYWKGRALWIAAKKGSLYWFIALLLINTAGLLEISYIYYFSKKVGCCGGGTCVGSECEKKETVVEPEKKEVEVEKKV